MLQGLRTQETREAAREVKFAVPRSAAEDILKWSRDRLAPDPHAAGASGDEYRTATLYFDTARLDVYHRRGSFSRSKYRVRRYGAADIVFLERKLRTAGMLVKRRTSVPLAMLPLIGEGDPAAGLPSRWFRQRIEARRLHPVCQVSYHRVARVGTSPTGPVRLTVDDEIRAQPNRALIFLPDGGIPVLDTQAIVEVKYRAVMPAVFEHLIQAFSLEPLVVSKYRAAMEALAGAGVAVDGM